MTATFIFSNLNLSKLAHADLTRFRLSAQDEIFRAFGEYYCDVELLEGQCSEDDISVCINIDSEELGTQKKSWRIAFISRMSKHINVLERKAETQPLSSPDNIILTFNPDFSYNDSDETEEYDDDDGEFDYASRARAYIACEPLYDFERVILPKQTRNDILEAADLVKYSDIIFDEWGLSATTPKCLALNFSGPPGTGKTMAAEAFARLIGKKIIRASYADIESKYHGEGPKMVKALFMAAQEQDAVIFIDEADSLLSKRLENVTQGSEQAINSMRSQLLISLENYSGVVIFATNLISNYDKAFISRLNCIAFRLPDTVARRKIWRVHLYPVGDNGLCIPLSENIDIDRLAEKYIFCGRDIREAVKHACIACLRSGGETVTQEHLVYGCTCVERKKAAAQYQDD